MSNDFDVIIVGGGGAGLAAAIEARKQGASCMVLEADTKLGGATALAGGVVYAAGTSVQRAAGVLHDTPDAMYHYMMTLNQWAMKPSLTRILSDESGPAVEWLIQLGTEFPPEWLVHSGVDDIPRGHPSKGAGGSVAEALVNGAGVVGAEYALGTRVEGLLMEDERIVGVRAGGIELRAAAVIITTGGFGNNPDMVRRLYPTAASHGDWNFAVHYAAPFILGDGITLGESVGARITGHDQGLLNPTTGFGKFIEAFLPPWIMLVNREGRRFMSETAPYAVSGYLMNEQTDRQCFAIFDEVALVEASTNTRFSDPYNSGVAMPTWEEPMIRQKLREGRVKTATTLDDLAASAGIEAVALANTVARYNADCDRGVDTQFFKQVPCHFPVRTAPFYALEVRAALIGATAAGLDIDEECQVLDTYGRPIAGLYAAGEVLGCTQGKRYVGGGISIAGAVVFGRRAGKFAACRALGR